MDSDMKCRGAWSWVILQRPERLVGGYATGNDLFGGALYSSGQV
jgi:hypothetical protein